MRNKFDLVISDIALPDGSGIELMMQLRAISKIPGIAISGFGNNGDIERSLQAGFSEHLIKPIKLDKLEAAIERAIAEIQDSLNSRPRRTQRLHDTIREVRRARCGHHLKAPS